MIPAASAGSSQVGASEIVAAQVTCPWGSAALARQGAATSTATARKARMRGRAQCAALKPRKRRRCDCDPTTPTSPACLGPMAFSIDHARGDRQFLEGPLAGGLRTRGQPFLLADAKARLSRGRYQIGDCLSTACKSGGAGLPGGSLAASFSVPLERAPG